MNAPSPWLRPLQGLAVVLALGILAMSVALLQNEAAPPTMVPGPATTAGPAAVRTGTDGPALALPTATEASAAAATRQAVPIAAAAVPAVLFGTVLRADGTLVDQGYCSLQQGGRQVGSGALRSGMFAFAGLQPGVHRLTSRIHDELPLDREVLVQAPHTRLDLQLAPRWLLTVNAVLPDGAPLMEGLDPANRMRFRDLRALALPEPLPGDLPSNSRGELDAGLGPFRANDPLGMRDQPSLPKQTVGVLTLPPDRAAHIALLLGSSLLQQQPVTPGQQQVTFVVDPAAVFSRTGSVRVRCLDAQGAPVVGAQIAVGGGPNRRSDPQSVTDAQGIFVAKELMPGRVDFTARSGELRLPPVYFDLAAGAEVDLGDVTLLRPVELVVSFAEFGGEGGVRAFWLDAPSQSRWRMDDTYCSAQGGLQQTMSLHPGRHGLVLRGKGGVAVLEIHTDRLPPGPLHPSLQRGAMLQIDNRIGTGIATFTIATANGIPVHQGQLGNRPGYGLPLPPGEYVVTVEGAAGLRQQRAFSLPAEGAVLSLP